MIALSWRIYPRWKYRIHIFEGILLKTEFVGWFCEVFHKVWRPEDPVWHGPLQDCAAGSGPLPCLLHHHSERQWGAFARPLALCSRSNQFQGGCFVPLKLNYKHISRSFGQRGCGQSKSRCVNIWCGGRADLRTRSVQKWRKKWKMPFR